MAIRPPKNNISDPKTGGVTREWLAWLQEIADAAIPPTTTPPGTPPASTPPGGGGGGGGGGSSDYGTGTPGFITKWLAAHELGDSIISESGGVITVNGDLIANSITGTYQPSDINTGGVANAFFLTDVTAVAAFHTSVPFSVWPTVSDAFDLGRSDRYWRYAYLTDATVANKLGVGTTTPTYEVDILSATSGPHGLRVKNTSTAGGNTHASIFMENSSSYGQLFKAGTGYVGYKNIQAGDLGFFNIFGGNISVLNDAGNISFASQGSTNPMVLILANQVGFGVLAPTANIHSRGVTTGANTAPLKFDSGVLMTSPEVGALEFVTDTYYATITTGTARKGIVLDNGARLTPTLLAVATTNGRLTDGPANAAGVLTNNGAGVLTWTPGGGVTGSGTTGKIPKWATSTSLTDSIMTETTGNISVAGSVTLNGPLINAWNQSSSPDGNLGIGIGVFAAITTGIYNTAFGYHTLASITNNRYSVAVGYRALELATVAYNTAVGYSALAVTTTGASNTAVGAQVLAANTTGQENVAIGGANIAAMQNNTTGSENVAVGVQSLFFLISGSGNTGVGYRALAKTTVGPNTAIGHNAGIGITTGTYNVCIGAETGSNWTTGDYNTGVGAGAGADITTATRNTLIGNSTGGGITTGSYNTIIGAFVNGLPAGLSSTIILADGVGSQRLYIDSAGHVGIAHTSPTAMLHLPAGATGANRTPLKFTSGAVMTTPEVGAVEFLTDDYFATITTAAARKAFVLDDGARLTSGRLALATTNGRLIDGPVAAGLITGSGTATLLTVWSSSSAVTSGPANAAGVLTNNGAGVLSWAAAAASVRGETPAGLVNGVNAVYTTAAAYAGLCVYLNGIRQQLTTHYTLTTPTTFTFTSAPLVGDIILVDYN